MAAACEMNLENAIAALILFTLAQIGIIVNILLIAMVFRVRRLQNAFGILCASNCVSGLGMLTVVAVWDAPTTMMNACHAIPVPGKYFGLITFFFWYGDLFASLSITINRFIAISFPLQYRQFFANRRCVIIFIILIWLLAAIEASPLIPAGCDFYFDPTIFSWTYSNTPCSAVLVFYNDTVIACSIVGLIALLDCFTFARIRHNNKVARRMGLNLLKMDKSYNQEVRFFVQALTSDILLIIIKLSFCIVVPWVAARGKWALLAGIPLTLEIMLIANPVIIICLNAETRRLILRPGKLLRTLRAQLHSTTSTSFHS